MASQKNKSISIKKYKNKRELNIGIFLFAVVLIYLIATVIMYLTDDKISVYEVREGSIVKDTSYTGLVLREESAVTAESGGYVSYYQNENSKVKTGANIYAVSPERLNTEEDSADDTAASTQVSQEIQSGISLQIQNFNENFKENDFSSVYSLKNEITSSLQSAYSQTRTEHLDAVIEASGQDVSVYRSQRDGVVAYSVDGYEGLTKDTFTDAHFDKSTYESTTFSEQMQVSAGDPVYRLITSENWSVIVPLDEETAKELKDQEVTSVRVRIDKDSESLWADISIISRDGKEYGCLDFDNSMIRYAADRFLNIELILEDESGLKIPKSSVVEEDFFVVPEECLTTGGNSSSDGVMIQDRNGNASFQAVDVFYTSEDGEVYLNKDQIEEGSVLVKPESAETYTVEETKPLKGVYNINRGYAVFRKVTILCESDEYYIVQDGETYGLSNYDHIVQNGAGVESEDVVFE